MDVTFEILEGPARRIWAFGELFEDGTLSLPYLDQLQQLHRQYPDEAAKLARILEFIANEGPPHNVQKYRKIEGHPGLYEIKTSRLRVFCFPDKGGLIICFSCYGKQSQKAPKHEIKKADALLKKYQQAKSRGPVPHISRKP